MRAYNPDTSICLIFAISICLLEKYFASNKIRTNLIGSDGCTVKEPRSSQLCEPLNADPTINKTPSNAQEIRNSVITIAGLFKKDQSKYEKKKNLA